MARIVKFYEKLPKGPAPKREASGLLGRYQARYFGENPSAARTSHPHGLIERDVEKLTWRSNLACYFRHHGFGIQHGILLPPEYEELSV